MAAMDQTKLNTMCTNINNTAEDYVSSFNTSVSNLTDAFNNNWVSGSSRALATEITDVLNDKTSRIISTFSNKNEAISLSVQNFNSMENESIQYPGFSFGQPNTAINISEALPNGKVGVADGADLNSIVTPIDTLTTNVSDQLDTIVTTVQNSDAFDEAEVSSLTTGVNKIKSDFVTEMNELKEQASTRMSNEIEARAQLDSTNQSNMEG